MKKFVFFTILVILSSMNLNMRSLNNPPEINLSDESSDNYIHEGNQSSCTDNPELSASEWNGRLTFEASRRFICTYQPSRQIEENKFMEQIVDLKFSVEQISFRGMSPVATIGDIDGSGTIKITLDDQWEEIRTEYLPNGTIADFGCPPITSFWKFEMQLLKRKK